MKSFNTIFRNCSSVRRSHTLLVLLIAVALAMSFLSPFAANACSCLTAYINEYLAQSVRKLTFEQSTQPINSADQINSDLGCL